MDTMGVLIAIEGTDGSGKRTQTEALLSFLTYRGLGVGTLSSPDMGMLPRRVC